MNSPEPDPHTAQQKAMPESTKFDLIEQFQNDVQNTKKKLYGASLTSTSSGNLSFSFSHLYAVDLGASPFIQSIITSTNYGLGNAVFQPYFGAQSDQQGRRPYLMLGFGALTITNFLVVIFQFLGRMTVPLLLLILAFQTILGSAWIPAWNAYLGDITSKKTRGSFMGKVTSIGTIFSILIIQIVLIGTERIGGALLDQYIIPFGAVALLWAFSWFFAWKLPETLRERNYSHNRLSIRKILKDNPRFKKFTIIHAFAMAAMSMTWPLYSFVYRGVINISPSQVALTTSAFMLTMAITQHWGGKFADKIGRKPGLILGRLFLTVYPLLIAFSKTWTAILVAEICSGVGSGFVMTLASVAVLDLTKEEAERGQFTATANLITGVMTFTGALLSGTLAQMLEGPLGGRLPAILFMLYVAAAMRFVSALLFFKIPETLVSQEAFDH